MENLLSEYCPYCGQEFTVEWDVNIDGWLVYCPHCGHRTFMCNICNPSECCGTQECPAEQQQSKAELVTLKWLEENGFEITNSGTVLQNEDYFISIAIQDVFNQFSIILRNPKLNKELYLNSEKMTVEEFKQLLSIMDINL